MNENYITNPQNAEKINQNVLPSQDGVVATNKKDMEFVMPSQDPFALSQFNNNQVPDEPIQSGQSMVEQLLNDDEVPETIKKKWWMVFKKDNSLTFLDSERKQNKLLNFDIMKIDMLNATPYYEFTFGKEAEFNIMRNIFETKLDRSQGFVGGNIKNERVILQSQFTETKNVNETAQQNQINDGFFKRLLGRR